jgi:mono/diheme cytochrome c family protein
VKILILPILVVALGVTCAAQAPDNNFAEQAGGKLFQDNCARCHGVNLEGTKKGPALAAIRTKKRWTDEKITHQILNGEGKMPPFRDSLHAEQIRQLIAFLRAEKHPTPQ